MELLVVTGMSGAGKSTALAALADIGFYCVDNIPVVLLPQLVAVVAAGEGGRRIAVGIDAREVGHLGEFASVQRELVKAGHRVEILFLDAPDGVLVRRFAETRRRHPLGELPDAITAERASLRSLGAWPTATIDTGGLRARELRQMIRDRYSADSVLHLVLMSFGFKAGLPSFADLVFDVRFLANPYDVPALRPGTGLDPDVAEFVLGQADAAVLLDHLEGLLRFVVPRSVREGRSYLTVALGCTGGQHRSVALTEALACRLSAGGPLSRPPPQCIIRHRDIVKGPPHA